MRYACHDRMCGAEDCETCHPGCNDEPETVEMWCPTCEERVDMKEDDDGECPRCGDEVMDEEPEEPDEPTSIFDEAVRIIHNHNKEIS
jgi:DNA-directed RNA polymerase subunit RPC12/RpoP